jgi:hypothetical protein
MFRLILKVLLLCFVFWVIAMIGLIGVFMVADTAGSIKGPGFAQNPLLAPLGFAWLSIVGLSWVAAVAWQIRKWLKPSSQSN